MKQERRDPLVGQFFLARDKQGRAIKAGRIREKTQQENYVITLYDAGRAPRGEIATSGQMNAERWELYFNEAHWRGAYAQSE